jgi:hypothetical protein
VEPEFQRALFTVLIAGTTVVGIGTVVLFLAFRAFGGGKPKLGLMAGLVAFVFLCCALLFALSYAAHR